MEQAPLTFDNWEQETRALRDRLAEKRKGLVALIEEHQQQLADVDARLLKLDVALGDAIEISVPIEAPKRDRGILVVVKGSVLPFIDGWTLESVVEAVHKIKPHSKTSSIRSALARLEKQGLLRSTGARGHRLYFKTEEEESKPGTLLETTLKPNEDPERIGNDEPVKGLGDVIAKARVGGSLVDTEKAEKTSLKATKVQGKMLFGGAQRPDHM